MSDYTLPIAGMSCASCAGRIERVVSKVPGVSTVVVNLANEQAHIEASAGLQNTLIEAVNKAGYSVPLEPLELSIEGMSCASCAGRIEKALNKVQGIVSAQVNLADETARLKVLEGFDPQQAISAIRHAGYDAHLQSQNLPDLHQRQLKRERLALAAAIILSLPLVLPMLLMPLGIHWMLPAWVQFLLATPVQFILGARFYRAAFSALRAGSGNMDQLVALGTSAGYGLSLYQWAITPAGQMPHLYFEASAVIITLILLGKYMESRAKRQTASAIKALQALRPDFATRLKDGQEHQVAIAELALGDVLVVKPGERFAVDGCVVEGNSHADEALISGESLPVAKQPGDKVTAGAINAEGRLLIETTALGAETVLARIIRLVEDAQAAKAPIQKLVDKVSLVFVPTVLLVALITLIVWLSLDATLEQAMLNAVAVLVIACPCALGLATPTAIMAGTGVAARHGILIKDASVLESAQRIKQVAFDKTGTLTEGRPRVVHLAYASANQHDLLQLAGALQQGSEHPLGVATQARCAEDGIDLPPVLQSRALTGRGTAGQVNGRALEFGNARLLAEHKLEAGALESSAQAWEAEGLSLSWLIETGDKPAVLGLLAFGDSLKAGAAQAVEQLRAQGILSHVISGDNQGAVASVAKALGIDQVHANVLPADKARLVSDLKKQGAVAMVGDGINDAPALACADIGIAMGGGTDAAMHAASITLMRGDPRLVPAALEISQRCYRKIKQNLFWAFIYNLIGLPLAACGLLNPMIAGAAMAASSVCVVSNALLLNRWRPKIKQPLEVDNPRTPNE